MLYLITKIIFVLVLVVNAHPRAHFALETILCIIYWFVEKLY